MQRERIQSAPCSKPLWCPAASTRRQRVHLKWYQQVQSPTLQNLKFNRLKTTGGNLIQD